MFVHYSHHFSTFLILQIKYRLTLLSSNCTSLFLLCILNIVATMWHLISWVAWILEQVRQCGNLYLDRFLHTNLKPVGHNFAMYCLSIKSNFKYFGICKLMYMYIVELTGASLLSCRHKLLYVLEPLVGMWACFSLAVEYKISLLNILYTFGKDEDILIALVSYVCKYCISSFLFHILWFENNSSAFKGIW